MAVVSGGQHTHWAGLSFKIHKDEGSRHPQVPGQGDRVGTWRKTLPASLEALELSTPAWSSIFMRDPCTEERRCPLFSPAHPVPRNNVVPRGSWQGH